MTQTQDTPAAPAGLCGCGQPVETSYQRHLTQAEYDALPESLRPIDGYATAAVHCCWDCHPGPLCEHPDTAPVPCPRCKAKPGQPCTKPDGSARLGEHRERATAQPVADTCTHAHREDCTSPKDCQCTGDDQPPTRQPRTFLPVGVDQQLTARGFPPGMALQAVAWAAAHGIDPQLIRGEIRTGQTQDMRPALLFDYATPGPDGRPLLDAHGREQVQLRIEPVEPPG
jgi:hypothetical protein